MATRETDRDQRDSRDADLARATAARAEVVDILAGAVVELLLQPSLEEARQPRKAPDIPVSRHIRGLP